MNKENETYESKDLNLAKILKLISLKERLASRQEALELKESIFQNLESRMSDLENRPEGGQKKKLFISFLKIASISLLVLVSSTLFYKLGKDQVKETETLAWIEMTTPLGTVSKLTLPDSTKVILNGGTTISYPNSFAKKREVHLVGEAYFDVVRNENIPLVINSHNLETTVLGTKFNLQSYPSDKVTSLTLLEGSVVGKAGGNNGLNEIIELIPNQQLRVNNESNEIWKQNVVAAEYILWTKGILNIKGLTINEIIPILERRYNITISLKNKISIQGKYYANFEHNETIDQVLDLLSHKRNWKYKKRKTHYCIYN